MQINFNGKIMDVEDGSSLAAFIASRKLDPSKIIIEYNTDIVDKEKWASIVLKESDALVVFSFVGGG